MTISNKDGIAPFDQLLCNVLEKCYKKNDLKLYDAVKDLTDGMDKSNKYKYKKKIEEMWALNMNTEKFEQEYEVYDFLCELTGKKENE